MNKEGFTLVELISIITLLALIIVLTIPTYNSVSNNIKNRNFESKKTVIEKQTIEFVNKYMKDETYPLDAISNTRDAKNICFSTRFLIVNGIITSDDEKNEIVINDVTGTPYSGDKIIVSVTYNSSSRKLVADSITDDTWSTTCDVTYK